MTWTFGNFFGSNRFVSFFNGKANGDGNIFESYIRIQRGIFQLGRPSRHTSAQGRAVDEVMAEPLLKIRDRAKNTAMSMNNTKAEKGNMGSQLEMS